jgi:hypothetical protein
VHVELDCAPRSLGSGKSHKSSLFLAVSTIAGGGNSAVQGEGRAGYQCCSK